MENKFGNNLKETQESLLQLLKFDYETFKNTANFEQGDSDSFSKLTPKEMKLVVMKILQLDIFEKYEKRSRELYQQLYSSGLKYQSELDAMSKLIDLNIETSLIQVERIKVIEIELIELNKTIVELQKKQQLVYDLNRITQTVQGITTLQSCPTCLQNVTEEHKQIIKSQYQSQIDGIKKLLNGLNVREELDRLNKLANAKNMEKGTLSEEIKSIERRNLMRQNTIKEKQQIEEKLTTIKMEMDIYSKLVKAFGKDGIPSYIIENAIPEIELIVNNLLETLEVDMSIEMITQKELKSGGLADTLDIRINSTGFIRPYYNFSGGEKFLIDLALRTALSVVLLRRKGCNNSTLILDEGFGSLDSKICNKVVQLINLIKEKYGFRKVLIITHVEEMKDFLSNKIIVTKQNGTSNLSYNFNRGE
jgi:exonuclease SbcC